MGAGSALLLAAAFFAAAPAPDAFRFDGPSASATVDGKPAALRVGGALREGTGSAFLRGEDRVRGREMTYGDAGELWVRAQAGGDVYRVELDAVGFPPEAALPRGASAKRGWWRKPELAPLRPEGSVEGGVVLGRMVNGGSGLGVRDMPARRAAVALWGIGRLYRNDELVAPRARILAQAVPAEAAPSSREGALAAGGARPELEVFVDHVPGEVGFIHLVLEGAAISEAPRPAAVARRGEPAPRKKETREERLSRRPTAEEMWDSGGPMIVWRDERAPAPAAQGPGAGTNAPGTAGATGSATASRGNAAAGTGSTGAAGSAPLATSAPSGATTSGSAPAANAPSSAGAIESGPTTYGAAPAANAPSSAGGAAMSGGAGAAAVTSGSAPVAATAPSSAGAMGAAGATPSSSGAYGAAMASAQPYADTRLGAQTVMVPPPPLMAVPATPLTAPIQYETGQNGGTIGIGQIGGGAGASLAYGGSGTAGLSPGTGVFNQAAPPPSGVFAPTTPAPTTVTPGIPAYPPLINTNGTPPVPTGAPAPLPQTPQPINAQPAPIPGATAPAPSR